MSPDHPARELTFWEHLGEFRLRIVLSVAGLAVGVTVAYILWRDLYELLLHPLKLAAPDVSLNYLSPQEPFVVSVRIALIGGVIFASPFIFGQAWAFVAPALTAREKRSLAPIAPVVALLFLAGVAFVYFVLLPVSLGFLIGYAPDGVEAMLTQDRYFGFVTALCLAGGLLFQLPAVLAILGWLGIVTASWLWRYSGWALVVLLILAAVITPTGDAFNMLVLTASLMGLYFIGIGIVWLIARGKRPAARE